MPKKSVGNLISKLLVLSALFLVAESSVAEGRCPPGQYPIGDSRAPGCAPIPAGSSADAGPRATGRWIKTWGAIAMSNSGASGVSVGKVKKREAEKAAMVECEATGARDCDIAFTYKHQCAAAATASSGTQGTNFGSGETVDVAKKVATELCQSRGGRGCGVVYSACTEPKFEAF
ncbi:MULTISPECIES: DUF4189 domain-containing protein [Stenotrophomonas maltophilia group]|uniref:DUF4189 domain-containing protein n=1 Tax=Stenotrophomonas maltophilia group TaxID=995085 RepID=UPI001C99D76A|nr:DUF4189 domain-containing protein [Stenotrophomonas maltophilia]MBY6281031.1 DUF4189 domain-containing protein [Stenotrophomonas maltophilia]